VIIAGSGRFGQIVNRLLRANDVPTVVLDREPAQIENMRQIRIRSFYGDATRPDLLHSAGVEQARLFVVAIDDREQAVGLVRHLKHAHPELHVLARAYDRGHHYALRDAGADYIVNETYHSALVLGAEALKTLGFHPFRAEKLRVAFDQQEHEGRESLYEAWRAKSEGERYGTGYQELYIQLEEALSGIMQTDRDDRHSRSERGWMPPPKGYSDALDEPPS
jgi:voltage-gated potassium channel Kch